MNASADLTAELAEAQVCTHQLCGCPETELGSFVLPM